MKHTLIKLKYDNIEGKNASGFPHHLHRIATEPDNIVVAHSLNTFPQDDEMLKTIVHAVNMHEELIEILRCCVIDAGLVMSKKERLDRIKYAQNALLRAERKPHGN